MKKLLMSLGIALLVGIVFANGFLENIEYMIKDGLYQRAGVVPSDIKIIAIDEETLTQLGPYSDWDRSYFVKLINILNNNEKASPKIIGMDIIFSGSNNEKADALLVETAEKYDNLVFASSIVVDTYLHNDNGEYYPAYYISTEGKPFEKLAKVAEYGFTNAIFDEDGLIRRAYTHIISEYNGEKKSYNSFAYTIASKLGVNIDYPPQVEIAYISEPGEFEVISMSEVLDGEVPAENFEDCIVLVGAYEEGMMDYYKVPVDYSNQMYGVEIQANFINAFLNDRIIYDVNNYVQLLLTILITSLYAYFSLNTRLRNSIIGMCAVIVLYVLGANIIYNVCAYKLNILEVVIGVVLAFLISLAYKYIEMQRKRIFEMRGMLFSMAEAMAEAIEGRTPYNANHTKNVAKRCVEMIDFINQKNREKKTKLHFTEADKQQIYLAAMLHDVGKMDVPLEVMDKPTKLGNRENELRDRLEIICLHIKNDALEGYITRENADASILKIHNFVENLGAFNCGRPLKEEEWALINEISKDIYIDKDGNEIPYLTKEEIDDLHIKAGTLSENERSIMQSHVIYTDKILSHMQFGEQFKNVRAMASNHHELLNGKGYPRGIREEEIDTMTRILTIMDIYDSLIADDRPYKKPKSVKVAFEILDEEAEAGKVDKELLEFAKELYSEEKKNG